MFGFIGINGNVVFKLFLIWIISSNAYGANPYNLGEINYFEKKILLKDEEEKIALDWKESSYTPPDRVLALLNNPTQENAHAYLNWQKQRIQRIFQAQQAIDQALEEGEEE